MKQIELTQGYVTLVDDEDFEHLSQWKWYAHKTNKASHTFYAVRTKTKSEGRGRVYMHREILRLSDSAILCDHRDSDGLNNQKDNLRTCNEQQNLANQQKGIRRSSQFKGVFYFGRGRKKPWVACLQNNKKRHNLGYFETERDAAIAYNNQAAEVFGQFAKLNSI